ALVADAGNPPSAQARATWSSTGLYLQTRPTGVRAIFLMCTLVNNLGSAASSFRIEYSLTATVASAEEVPAHAVYYSLSGLTNEWIRIPALFINNPTCCYVTNMSADVILASNWDDGSRLFLLFADDNGSGAPDVAYQIDNFSVTAGPIPTTSILI